MEKKKKKKKKEQREDQFKIWKVTAISKLVNKCIEPFAIKIVQFIVCWLKNIPFVVSEVWNIVNNMMSGKKKSNYSGIKCLLLSYQYICLSLLAISLWMRVLMKWQRRRCFWPPRGYTIIIKRMSKTKPENKTTEGVPPSTCRWEANSPEGVAGFDSNDRNVTTKRSTINCSPAAVQKQKVTGRELVGLSHTLVMHRCLPVSAGMAPSASGSKGKIWDQKKNDKNVFVSVIFCRRWQLCQISLGPHAGI